MHNQVVSNLEESLSAEHPATLSAKDNVRASTEIEPPNP
jgi:hypothetical protein